MSGSFGRRPQRGTLAIFVSLAALAAPLSFSAAHEPGGGSDRADRVDHDRGPHEVREVRETRDRTSTTDRTDRVSGSRGGDRSGGGHTSGSQAVEGSRAGGSSGSSTPSGTSGGDSGTSGSPGTSGSSDGGSGSSSSSGTSGSSDGGSGSGSSEGGSGSSGGSGENSAVSTSVNALHDLAARESPEFDPQGFPVRRGEVVALALSPSQLDRAKALGFRVIRESKLASIDTNIVRLRAPAGRGAGEALRLLRSEESGGTYDFDHYYAATGHESGPAAAPERPRAKTTSATALPVGMIDTAVAAHPMLREVKMEGRDFSGAGAAAPTAHGTAVASILAAHGVRRVITANVFKPDPRMPYTSADALAMALDWLAARGIAVINISIAGPHNAVLDQVIARVSARGHLIVAAAGNAGPTAPPAYPAADSGVVAVTAVDSAGRVYRYANQGNYIQFAAPGVGVTAASPGGQAAFTGTSFAAPLIAADLARCMGKGSRADYCLAELQARARHLGPPGRNPIYGYGLITD